ncbi:37S ribosomal protein S35 [Colletotrichum trifolii]|uniref:37S ribosomal protein S35 n=1 Tax=Colletotrichum trifolii TaxID=5466 RepID=A0A4R8RT34_COLTR|nr:37S ribosomal protein S35 [Colletotrichum trifolii]
MPPRAGSSVSPLAIGAKWCDAHASKALRSRPSAQAVCQFSTTPQQSRRTKAQHDFYRWQKTRGLQFRDAPENGPKYIGPTSDQPFPMNPLFKSQPVLSEDMREEIYKRVKHQSQSLKAVSASLGVDVRRVAAVVRMKEIEQQWVAESKPLAKPYAKAILGMLPQTPLSNRADSQNSHEPINEIHVHKLTLQQLFVPVSESREFTREDAAHAFHRNMLSADERSPLKELVDLRKDLAEGYVHADAQRKFQAATRAEEDRLVAREHNRLQKDEKDTKRVDTGRFEFRFKEITAEDAGKSGRGRKAVGWRYGVPFYDRRKGEVKIPTSVP